MSKEEYLNQLHKYLRKLPKQDYDDAMDYFEEYFQETDEAGAQKLIEEMGTPKEAARELIANLLDKKMDEAYIHLPSHKIHTLLLTTWILLSYPRSRYMSDSVKRGSSDRYLSLLPQLPSPHSRHTGFSPTRQVPAGRPFAPHNIGNLHPERDRKNKYVF